MAMRGYGPELIFATLTRRDGVSTIILEGKQAAKPGDHYIVRPLPADTGATYTTFPEGPNE